MSNAIAEATFNKSNESVSLANQPAFLIATDGTPQTDAAISIARQLPRGSGRRVDVLTVVDTATIPWGGVDRSLVLEYERGALEEAQKKASEQLRRLGDKAWRVEVRTGQPAAVIAAMASESKPPLVIVGLGGHGPTARFFGNETALRLARISPTPVLAVSAGAQTLPSRIVVAMDFREPSIEAARLALTIAARGATMTLVHVVPWERREYIPEHWFREHEEHIGAQLKRVAGWLNSDNPSRIHQRILYGKPGPAVLAAAEDLKADLIVAGTHGRGFLGRVLGGETISKLIRGARCSVLVFPHASAFQKFERHSPDEQPVANQETWIHRLDDFTRRNMGRRAHLEVDDPTIGAQVEMRGYRFLGATYDLPSKRAQLMFGSMQGTDPHLVRGISNVKSVDVLSDANGSADHALSVVNDDGQTLLVLEAAKETE